MASKTKRQVRIPPLQLALGLLLLMMIVGALFYFMVYEAKEVELRNLNTQLTQQNSRVAELQDTRRNLLEVQAKADRLEKRFELLKAKLPETQEDLNEFLSAISQRAQNARLSKWILFEQLAPVGHDKAQGVDRVPINLVFLATYESATSFFWELSQMGEGVQAGVKEQIVNVRNINFERSDKSGKGVLKVSCVAETFLYRGVPEAQEDGGGKGKTRRGGKK